MDKLRCNASPEEQYFKKKRYLCNAKVKRRGKCKEQRERFKEAQL